MVDGGLGGMCMREDRQVHFFVRKKLITSCFVIGRSPKQWLSIAEIIGISGR